MCNPDEAEIMRRPVTPLLTVDIIIEMNGPSGSKQIVLIERKNPPFGWALPGGFVDVGETIEQAAIREALEETTLEVQLKNLLGIYSDPLRDTRGHTVSAVYIAKGKGEPQARDDARNIGLFKPESVPELVFDHAQILEDYKQYLQSGVVAPLRI
jgi:8-oxo-dGTP diphosphatase